MAHTHVTVRKYFFLASSLPPYGLNIVPYLHHCVFLVDFQQHQLPVLVVEQPQAVGVVEELEQEQEVNRNNLPNQAQLAAGGEKQQPLEEQERDRKGSNLT